MSIVLLIAIQFSIITKGINNPITDHHAFRQTQTATTAYWMVNENMFQYIVPVTLPPWNMHRELPLYQFIVACLSKVTGMQIELSSRIVSLFFYYLSIYYLVKVSRVLFESPMASRITFVSLMLSPVYVFWSRTCMIESLALFLSSGFLYYSLLHVKGMGNRYVALALFSILSALVKITTFFPSLVFVILYTLITNKKIFLRKYTFFLFGITFFAVLGWYVYCMKMRSYDFLYNETVKIGYGWVSDFHNKILDPYFYQNLWWQMTSLVLPSFLFFAFIFICPRRYFLERSLLALSFFVTFGTFANLYTVHDYYVYGSGFLLILCFAGSVSALIQKIKPRYSYLIVLTIGLFSFYNYLSDGYYLIQNKSYEKYDNLKKCIDSRYEKNAVGLLCGEFINPIIPYSIGRKFVTIGDYREYPIVFGEDLARINKYCATKQTSIAFALMPNEYEESTLDEVIAETFDFKKISQVGKYTLYGK